MRLSSKFPTDFASHSLFENLCYDGRPFEWTTELYKRFNEIETSPEKDAEIAIHYIYNPFFITVDAPYFV